MRKLILASLTISTGLAAQGAPSRGSLEQRVAALLDAPPFARATWQRQRLPVTTGELLAPAATDLQPRVPVHAMDPFVIGDQAFAR